MRGYLRALVAELLKYRRTVALWLALGIPALIAGLAWVILTQSELANAEADRKWAVLLGATAQNWVTTCLPIGGAILIGMVWGLEHSSNQLKSILAQPPSRHAIFWAKTTGIFALIAIGTTFLGLLTAMVALAVGIGPVRWDVAFEIPFRALLGALPALALISWLAQRFSSFALPLIAGVAGLVIGGVASNSEEYWPYVPWSWSIVASMGADSSAKATALALGLGVGIAALAGSWLHFFRADAPT